MYIFKELKKLLKKDLTGLPSIKVALVGDTATQFLATAIKGMGVERGYHINLFEAEYNQVERQFMDPTSDLYEFDSDFIVVFQSTHKIPDMIDDSGYRQLIRAELGDSALIADYSRFEFPDSTYYGDLEHLNFRGARYFSKHIAKNGLELKYAIDYCK